MHPPVAMEDPAEVAEEEVVLVVLAAVGHLCLGVVQEAVAVVQTVLLSGHNDEVSEGSVSVRKCECKRRSTEDGGARGGGRTKQRTLRFEYALCTRTKAVR